MTTEQALKEAATRMAATVAFLSERLVEIGEMAGPIISLPAAALRSSGLEIYGSGGGSIPREVIVEAVPQVMALAARGALRVDTEVVPLAEIEHAWQRTDLDGRRLVIIP